MNLAHILDDHDDDAVAIISRGRATTYGSLRAQVAQMRGGLRSVGVGDGDRVALLCSNSVHFVVSYFSIIGIGAVAVPMNPLSPSPEIESELQAVGASTVIIEKLSTATWANVDRASVPTVTNVITCDVANVPDGVISIDDLMAGDPGERVEVEPDHLSTLIFTSGTAGTPRAAMLTHRNLASNLEQCTSVTQHVFETDVVFVVLPMFHIYGLNICLNLALSVGATVVLVQRFDPVTAIDSIAERGVTVVPGTPSMWAAFAHLDEPRGDEFAGVRLALSGASRLATVVAKTIKERFGLEISEGYGLTETSPVVTSSIGAPIKFGSVGRVLDGVGVRLVNADGDIPVGDVGEIWVKGPNVFAGYFDADEVTASVFTADGWLRTGDMATVDDDGYVYLVDRAKDLVIVSGFNVFPAEVEEVLEMHPDVEAAGVVGVVHPHTGEAVKAFVVARDGSDVDEESLIEFCRERIARYKCPSKVLFVDELPRNTGGKLLRRQLDT